MVRVIPGFLPQLIRWMAVPFGKEKKEVHGKSRAELEEE